MITIDKWVINTKQYNNIYSFYNQIISGILKLNLI